MKFQKLKLWLIEKVWNKIMKTKVAPDFEYNLSQTSSSLTKIIFEVGAAQGNNNENKLKKLQINKSENFQNHVT